MKISNLFLGKKTKYWLLPLAVSFIAAGSFLSGHNNADPSKLNDKAAENFSFISTIAENVSPAVVSVQSVSKEGEGEEEEEELVLGSGSGLIFSQEGYIITNFHVISDADDIIILLSDGRQAAASLVGSYPDSDLALLKIELPDLPVATLGNSEDVKVGDLAFAIGNPGGEQFARSLTMGVISGIDREMVLSDGNHYRLIQTDAAINPGNSGGPLVNCAGQVIGINSVKIVDADFEGMGFAIPINTVREVVEKISPTALDHASLASAT